MLLYITVQQTSDSTKIGKSILNQTMTSARGRLSSCVGGKIGEKNTHVHGATRRASSNGRKPGSPDQPATRNRMIRWSCPCFPWVLVLSRRATWHRAGIRVSLFPPVVTVIFQTLGQLPSDPSTSERNRRRSNPQLRNPK